MIPITTVSVSAGTVIENAISWAVSIANDDSHGYSWDGRWGPDYDCSSLVISAFREAGLSLSGATTTVNMRSVFVEEGFTWIPASQIDLSNPNSLIRGDILLNESSHTEIYLGNGQNVGAHRGYKSQWCSHSNNDGKYHRHGHYSLGEQKGDQDGGEISVAGYYNYPWDGILRYKDEPNYVNVGDDFYAYIINTDSWLLATNDNGNVNVSKENYNSNQVWHFTRLSNGSYKIVSQKDNSCMEVHNFETQNGTNVEMHPYNDNSAQHWYIYGKSAQYIFRAECGDNVLDLSGGAEGAGNGTNLQMWENNGTNAQKFQIWKLDFPSLGIPNVEVSNYGGTNGDNIKLTWNSCENATGYDIRIYDESGNNNLYMYYNVQGTSFTTRIPSGNYIAEVTALNSMFNTWQFGTQTFFSCSNNLGTDFYAYIINTASWLLATNDNGNVNVSQESNNLNQVWHFSRLSNGSYKIVSYIDNNCMEVHNFESSNGTNVEMHSYNDNSAQHWFISGESGQYVFRAECGDNVLDLSGGAESATNGSNLQMWESNGSDDQKFQIWEVDPADIHWHKNYSLVNLGDSFSARIRNVNLDVLLTNFEGNVVIGKHYYNKIARQIWKFSRNANGSYKIKSCLNENCMELHNFDDFDGGNIACISENGSTAQNWFIYQNNEGSYYLRPECSQDRVIDITEGNPSDGNNLQLWSYNGHSNQKFSIEKCGEVVNCGEDFSASIEHTNYWKPIFQNDNGNVELTTSSREKMSGILWHFVRDNDNGWYTIMSYKNGKYLEVADSSNEAGANVQCGEYNNGDGQHWYILKGNDSNGEYHYLKSACSSNNLDLDYNNIDDGTNIKMWSNTSSDAQKYSVYIIGGETTYSISTNKSKLTLGESAELAIDNTTFVTSYKFHIIQPNGQETVVDNKCNPQFTFTPKQAGQYTVYCEVESPVSKSKGSSTDRSITINVLGKIGDTNLDGKINVRDVTAIQRHLADLEEFNEEHLAVADTNGDGVVDIADATHLQMYLAEYDIVLG